MLHPERFTALYGEEKSEEGGRGDQDKRRNQKRRTIHITYRNKQIRKRIELALTELMP